MRRGRLRKGGRLAALLVAGLLALPWPAGAVGEEIAPDGGFLTRVSLRLENQDSAFDQSGESGPMKNFLIKDPLIRDEISGDITREVTRYDLRFTYGLSDTWNLSLNLPFVEVRQNSTLTANAGASTGARETADLLQSATIQGLGDVELTSLHRPLFSDWNAFTWGYGITYPGSSQKSPYVGTTSLELGRPAPAIHMFIQYTRYPAVEHARFDFSGRVVSQLGGAVTVPGGAERRLQRLNEGAVRMDWTHEIGYIFYGLGIEFLNQSEHTLSGQRLADQIRAQFLRLSIGMGNLAELEQGPIAFPYQLRLEFQDVQRGANIPNGSHITLSLQMFF